MRVGVGVGVGGCKGAYTVPVQIDAHGECLYVAHVGAPFEVAGEYLIGAGVTVRVTVSVEVKVSVKVWVWVNDIRPIGGRVKP